MSARESNTYQWMLHHARLMGWDLDAVEIVDGAPAPVHRILLVWAAIALGGGLNEQQHAHLARAFGVTEDDFRAVWQPEMRARDSAEILAHPELRDLDRDLDDLT
jgi:hypothetical protein